MNDLVGAAVDRLRTAGVKLTKGLSAREFRRVEETFSITFSPQHREFLATCLSLGDGWPDWRRSAEDDLQRLIDWPTEGVLFDVAENGFWPLSWGIAPTDRDAAQTRAREHLSLVPRLIPIHSHRYLPANPASEPAPVLSVYQTDVIIYGDNLLDYVAHEFGAPPMHPTRPTRIPFWSDLAEGFENADL